MADPNLLDIPNLDAVLKVAAAGATKEEKFFLLYAVTLDTMRKARAVIDDGDSGQARQILADFLEEFDAMEKPKIGKSIIPSTSEGESCRS
jgi:hypothetical protein